jgi:hypothetical protein
MKKFIAIFALYMERLIMFNDKYTFTFESNETNHSVNFESEQNLTEILEKFRGFLILCGYSSIENKQLFALTDKQIDSIDE